MKSSQRRASLINPRAISIESLLYPDKKEYFKRSSSFSNILTTQYRRRFSSNVKSEFNIRKGNDPAFTHLMAISKEVKALRDQNNILKKQYEKVEFQRLKNENSTGVGETEDLTDEISNFTQKIKIEQSKWDELNDNYDRLKKYTEDETNNKLEKLHNDIITTDEDMKVAESDSLKLEAIFQALKKKRKFLEDDNKKMSSSVDTYNTTISQHDSVQDNLNKLQKQLETKMEDVTKLVNKTKELQKTNTTCQQEAEELRKKVKNKEQTISNIKSKNIDLIQKRDQDCELKLLLSKQNEVLKSIIENVKKSVERIGYVPNKVRNDFLEECKSFVNIKK